MEMRNYKWYLFVVFFFLPPNLFVGNFSVFSTIYACACVSVCECFFSFLLSLALTSHEMYRTNPNVSHVYTPSTFFFIHFYPKPHIHTHSQSEETQMKIIHQSTTTSFLQLIQHLHILHDFWISIWFVLNAMRDTRYHSIIKNVICILCALLLLYVVQRNTHSLSLAFAGVNVQEFCFGRQNRSGCHWRDEGWLIIYVAAAAATVTACVLPYLKNWHSTHHHCDTIIKSHFVCYFFLLFQTFCLWKQIHTFECTIGSISVWHFVDDTDHLRVRMIFVFSFIVFLSKTVKSVYFNGAI